MTGPVDGSHPVHVGLGAAPPRRQSAASRPRGDALIARAGGGGGEGDPSLCDLLC